MNDKNLILRKQTLVNIADAIRAKTGSTNLIKISDLDDAVTNLQGGGSGDGSVLIEYDAPGIVVPNTGYVEKVYCNTALSNAEIEALLSQLTYDNRSREYYVAVTDTTGLMCFGVEGMYGIADLNFNIFWCNEVFFNNLGSDNNLTHFGWQEFTNPIEINGELISEDGIGTQNDLLLNLFSITPFGEKATKNLSGTYDGTSIVANGDVDMSALINEKKIPLSIKVPEILIEASQETIVPNTGYVEKVYVNKSLSNATVEALLSQLTYNDNNGRNENIIVTENNQKAIYCYKRNNSCEINLYDGDNDIHLWNNRNGWLEFDNPIEINSNVVNTTEWGAPVGTQNNLLISLFSATPFEKITKTLSGTYDGSEITIKSGWDGTAIPNTGTIQNLYANTNLSEDEVLTELNKLNYVYQQAITSLDASKRGMYSIVNIPDLYLELLIQVGDGEALIATSDFNFILFATAGTDVGFVGWNTDLVANEGKIPLVFAGPVSEEDEEEPSYEVIPVSNSFDGSSGAENSKITGLFSTTPFVYNEFDGNINVEEYIDNQKIPLNIKVDIDSNNGAEVTLGNAVPNSGYVEKVYFNTALTIEEVVAELDKLTYTEISYAETSLEGATNHWNCLLTTSTTDIFVIVRDGQIAIVEDYSGETLFSNTGGWNPDFSGEIEVNSNASDYYQETVAGVENYKITKLFSATPEFSEEYIKKLIGTYNGSTIEVTDTTINISQLLNGKKLPLSIEVKEVVKNSTITEILNKDY